MQFTTVLALGAATLSPVLAVALPQDAPPQYSFEVWQSPDCNPITGPPLNISGSNSLCSPAPEWSFDAVKINALNPYACSLYFVNDYQCKDVLASSPGSIPIDGQCHALPSGTLTYNVVCS